MSDWADNFNDYDNDGLPNPLTDIELNVNTDDGSCYREGCTYEWAINYDSQATTDDGSCIPVVEGCWDSLYLEYNSEVNVDNGSCTNLILEGCMNETAFNYNSEANTDNGSCEFICSFPSSWEYVTTGSNHTMMILRYIHRY